MHPLAFTFAFFIFTLRCLALSPSQNASLPVNFGVLLFPNFETIDVFGPVEPLNFLSYYFPLNLHIISPSLSPVSQASTIPKPSHSNSHFAYTINPTHNYTHPPPLDVLLIPGGGGTRSPDLGPTIQFVRDVYPGLKYLITVCTGAGVVARAGILDGRRATTNKAAWRETTALSPKVNWVPKARWIVDGNVWTTSGISAGIDGTLDFIGQIFGRNYSESIAVKMEYKIHTNPSWDPFADIYNTSWPIVSSVS